MTFRCVDPTTASALCGSSRHCRCLSTGCPLLDGCLGGGIDTTGIVELAGTSGTGKTQLALQLMLQAMLPENLGGLGGGAVYLHTSEPGGILKRLEQLVDTFTRRHKRIGARPEYLMERVRRVSRACVLHQVL